MRVFCSGISGVGATEYIKQVVAYAKEKGDEIKVFNVGKEVFEAADRYGFPITSTGVLDLGKRTIHYLTGAVYEKIAGEIAQYPNCIIDAHLHFRWRGAIVNAVTPKMVDLLKPDVYVTLMDLSRPILENLKRDREQWKYEFEKGHLTIPNVLDWQNYEVNTTEQWAAFRKKPMYVLPSKDSPDSLHKLTTRKDAEVAYVSFPISHIRKDEQSNQKIIRYIEQLRQFKDLAIISPKSLMLPEDPTEIENQHTVMQDLEWFVEKSTKRLFVYFPTKVYSKGVDSEATKAKESCREVWFTAPKEMEDPFTNATLHRRFNDPEECIEALVKSGMLRQKI